MSYLLIYILNTDKYQLKGLERKKKSYVEQQQQNILNFVVVVKIALNMTGTIYYIRR